MKIAFNKLAFCSLVILIGFNQFGFAQKKKSYSKTSNTLSRNSGFKIVGYFTQWGLPVNQIPFSNLTHINYAFLVPDDSGNIKAISNSDQLKDLVTGAHKNNVKVLFSLGGVYDGKTLLNPIFIKIAADDNKRNHLIDECERIIKEYNFDGIDMDWEQPDTGKSAIDYIKLMSGLRTKLGKNIIITAAVNGALPQYTRGIYPEVFKYVDWLNIMAYDENNLDHSSFDYAQRSINLWLNKGLKPSKLVLGIPFYGKPGWIPYKKLIETGADQQRDEYNNTFYNGKSTIEKKIGIVQRKKLGGIMIWTINYDTNDNPDKSLLRSINKDFKRKR